MAPAAASYRPRYGPLTDANRREDEIRPRFDDCSTRALLELCGITVALRHHSHGTERSIFPMMQTLKTDVTAGLKHGLLIGAVAAAVIMSAIHFARLYLQRDVPAVSALVEAPSVAQSSPRFADFGDTVPPPDVRRVADWAADSRDNAGLDFIVLDKREAHVYVFDQDGRLRDHTPVLLGAAAGDDTVEGVGKKALHEVKPEERTTPAGRFVGESGRNSNGEDIFWVDYAAAVSMHRLRQIEASERRLERLATPTAADNRISYGCINMPLDFYESVMVPTFLGRKGMVYVLPETRSLEEAFPNLYDVASRYRAALRAGTVG